MATELIRIRRETRDRLQKLKHTGQSFDGVIQDILKEFEKKAEAELAK